MYSYEDQIRAVELYIKLGKRVRPTIRQLGYLSPIIDCFDGMVVSWTIGTSPDAELVNSMLERIAVISAILPTDPARWVAWHW
ncbi:hypothetical protein ACFIQG_21700 [Comamonas odontotermitis]|uniref:hypothetical protein n=1 Tax=Comamonas odontotermitis TaxID=379895 RepID=UPI00366F0B52